MEWPVSKEDVFAVKEHNFNEIALEIFRHQAANNVIYNQYLTLIGCTPSTVRSVSEIPFLPIEFFKSHTITTGTWQSDDFFESSSTTGLNTSKHYIRDVTWYEESFRRCFEMVYSDVSEYCILALLPNYLERGQSSLVYMTQDLITRSTHELSGFYLYNHEALLDTLHALEQSGQKTILIGVSFALLDFAQLVNHTYQNLTIIETGGMKGRRKEMTRFELHNALASAFGDIPIHSEYGMTELFSQAYSTSAEMRFACPPWMKVLTTELEDPFQNSAQGKSGLLNVVDLSNIQTCSFIATSDIGRLYEDGTFEVLGRFDHSEQRGCNLMIT